MIINKNIFISSLDWGLGHASRCVPIIQNLKKNNNLIIGVTELNAFFFEEYFPEIKKITVPSYSITYSKILPLWMKLLLQWPKISKIIALENRALQKIIQEHKINLVISDNRFGMYSKEVESIFITHQLNIKAPVFSSFINQLNRKYIHRFHEVWVPDFKEGKLRLSGQLSDSDGIQIPVKYIDPQSALVFLKQNFTEKKIDYLFLLSGVEPQRTLLENELLEKFKESKKEIVLVRGTIFGREMKNTNIKMIAVSYGEELRDYIVNSETVICRSGYSTLMDLYLLNKKKIVLIPTPGQSEQEYLADYWKEKFGAEVYDLKEFRKNFKIH